MNPTRLYPDPSELCPNFLAGQLELDDMGLVSFAVLGEALLSVQNIGQPLGFAIPLHALTVRAGSDSSRFMFGLLPKQPRAALPDRLILNLGPTEQA